MVRVLLLGADGMLGSVLADVFGRSDAIELDTISRSANGFDARTADLSSVLGDCDWAVNAIGFLRSRIDPEDDDSVAEAFAVNAEFPRRLARDARPGQRVLHVSTDAVFSGAAGPYDELRPVDAVDVYGKSKAAGEVTSPRVLNLRCSILGRTTRGRDSLIDWAVGQPREATIDGWANQRWNGLTTPALARMVEALIARPAGELPPFLHLAAADSVTKAELLELALSALGRADVTVRPTDAATARDARLETQYPELIDPLWRAAGYERIPTVAEMLTELAAYGVAPSG